MTKKKYDASVYDPQTIKNIREQWLVSLLELSDIDYQRDRWLDKRIRNPHYSYVEFMCGYFDDVLWDAGYQEMIDCGYFSQEEYRIVKEFHEALDTYQEPNNDHYDHEAILNDPKWQEIVSLGKTTMKKLEEIITDKDELDLFDNYIHPLTEGDFTWGLSSKNKKERTWLQGLTRFLFRA